MKSIVEELYNREIPICFICKENPEREGMKTCSMECSKKYEKTYRKTEKYKEYNRLYQKTFYQKNKKDILKKLKLKREGKNVKTM